MAFFNSAVGVLQTLVVALGAGLGIWGAINLLEGYGKAARNMALRHKSKRKPLFSLDALADEPDGRLLAEEVIRTEERNRILHFCMDEMNPDYREVLYLTYFEDMSYAQAAEVTGKTVKQITNMVYRGKESLRRLLEREGIKNAES